MLKRMICYLEVRELEAKAFTQVYMKKIEDVDRLQEAITNVCENMASTFMEKFAEVLADESLRIELKRYLCTVGASQKHSGKRVHEALYKELTNHEKHLTI